MYLSDRTAGNDRGRYRRAVSRSPGSVNDNKAEMGSILNKTCMYTHKSHILLHTSPPALLLPACNHQSAVRVLKDALALVCPLLALTLAQDLIDVLHDLLLLVRRENRDVALA